MALEEIGGQTLVSKNDDKLLGIQVSSDLDFKCHINGLCDKLKQRLGLLRRIKHKINNDKLQVVAEAIFTSKIRYALAVYGTPRLKTSDPQRDDMKKLQVLQNDMLRVVYGYRRSQHVNMNRLRKEKGQMSVNQLTVYHVALETRNIHWNNSSTELKDKMVKEQGSYSLRSDNRQDLAVPPRPKKGCTGFSYTGSQVWNNIPTEIRNHQKPLTFKSMLKKWIFNHVPS